MNAVTELTKALNRHRAESVSNLKFEKSENSDSHRKNFKILANFEFIERLYSCADILLFLKKDIKDVKDIKFAGYNIQVARQDEPFKIVEV